VNKMGETRSTRRVWCLAVVAGREVSDSFAGLNAGISVNIGRTRKFENYEIVAITGEPLMYNLDASRSDLIRGSQIHDSTPSTIMTSSKNNMQLYNNNYLGTKLKSRWHPGLSGCLN
jgi:hypothetical protein